MRWILQKCQCGPLKFTNSAHMTQRAISLCPDYRLLSYFGCFLPKCDAVTTTQKDASFRRFTHSSAQVVSCLFWLHMVHLNNFNGVFLPGPALCVTVFAPG